MTWQWFNLAFKLQGSVAPIILPRVLIFAGFALGVSVLHYYEPQISLQVLGDLTNNVVFNLVLGLLLVFRTNTAYDRYWEGRKAWGTLVVNIRNLSRLMLIDCSFCCCSKPSEDLMAICMSLDKFRIFTTKF